MASTQSSETDAESVAHDLMEYLQEQTGVCAKGNVHGWRWIRFTDGEWRAVKYSGKNRRKEYVSGEILDREKVLEWMISKPVEIIPTSEAFLWGPKSETVWQDAEDQDVFTDASRCYWCGQSERSVSLETHETTKQGECQFCSDCYESWAEAGEIA